MLKLTISRPVPLVLLCMFYNNMVNFKKGSKVVRHQALHQHLMQAPNDFKSRTTQNQEGENDEYMDVNNMAKTQSIINSQAQEKLKFSLFANPVRTTGVGLTKTDARATYGLCFRRFRYRWKAKKIIFLTHLVPRQNMLGSDVIVVSR